MSSASFGNTQVGQQMSPFTQGVSGNNSNVTPGLNTAARFAMQGGSAGPAAQYGAAQYKPTEMQAAAYNPANPIQAGQLSRTGLSPYMNPYTQRVTNTVMKDLRRQNDILQNGVASSAEAAGAFGGSRHGVAEAETNRAFLDTAARTSAGLRQDAFNTALQSAQFDIGNRLGADQFNANAQNAAGQFNAGNQQAANAANQNAYNAGGQFNATAQQQAASANAAAKNSMSQFNAGQSQSTAGTLANLQNLGFGQRNLLNQQMLAQGNQVQGLQQALIDRGRDQTMGFNNSPQQSLATILAAIGGVPAPVSTETSQSPGIMGLLGAFL